MPNFDKVKQQNKLIPAVNKLLLSLKGITFCPVDEETGMNNVVFTRGSLQVKMSHHSFYRYSGIAFLTKPKLDNNGKETNWTEIITVTDDMYYSNYIRPIILKLFEVQEL